MPRLAGVDIPGNKHIWVSLTYIQGIGRTTSKKVLAEAGIDEHIKADSLSEDEISRIAGIIDRQYMIEGQLRRAESQNIQRLTSIGCYRGLRHRRGLPVRGQRTRTNARTRKGRKKTVKGKKRVGKT
ncbi:MAG: 30S ribosomal protein S13 [Planctomycetes bacterium]|nr:30S ribosomal protein S13 [Planctomycetota bacterium]